MIDREHSSGTVTGPSLSRRSYSAQHRGGVELSSNRRPAPVWRDGIAEQGEAARAFVADAADIPQSSSEKGLGSGADIKPKLVTGVRYGSEPRLDGQQRLILTEIGLYTN